MGMALLSFGFEWMVRRVAEKMGRWESYTRGRKPGKVTPVEGNYCSKKSNGHPLLRRASLHALALDPHARAARARTRTALTRARSRRMSSKSALHMLLNTIFAMCAQTNK